MAHQPSGFVINLWIRQEQREKDIIEACRRGKPVIKKLFDVPWQMLMMTTNEGYGVIISYIIISWNVPSQDAGCRMQVKIANKMRSHLGCHSRILGESEHAKFYLVAIFCLFKMCIGIQLRPPCQRLSIIYFQELNFYYTGNFNKVPGVFHFLSSKPAKLAVLLADAGLLTTWPAGGQHTQQVQPGDGYSSSDLVDVLLRAAILPTKSSRKYWWEGEVRGWSWWVDLRVNRLLA